MGGAYRMWKPTPDPSGSSPAVCEGLYVGDPLRALGRPLLDCCGRGFYRTDRGSQRPGEEIGSAARTASTTRRAHPYAELLRSPLREVPGQERGHAIAE